VITRAGRHVNPRTRCGQNFDAVDKLEQSTRGEQRGTPPTDAGIVEHHPLRHSNRPAVWMIRVHDPGRPGSDDVADGESRAVERVDRVRDGDRNRSW